MSDNTMKIKKLSIISVLFLFVHSIYAQDVKHSFGGWLGGGYSSFMHNINYLDTYSFMFGSPDYVPKSYNSSVPGGVGGQFGIGYELNIGTFLLQAGAEFSYLTSTTRFENLYFEKTWEYIPNGEKISDMYWKYDFEKYYTDKQRAGFVQIPLLAGAKIGRFYGLAGAKYGINLLGNYNIAGVYSTKMKDEQLFDDMDDLITHFTKSRVIIERERGTTGILKFSHNLIVSAEVGVILDDWIYPKPPPRRNSSRPLPIPPRPSYRVALFADYGLFNLIKNNARNTNLVDYYQTPYFDEESESMKLHVETPLDLCVNQLFNTQSASEQSVNSLLAGVKITVLMPIAEKVQKKPVRRPQPRPQQNPPQRPQRPQPQPSVFYARVVDAKTGETLAANYKMVDEKTKKELFKGLTNSNDGLIKHQLNSGKYSFFVDKDGYVYFSSNVTTVGKDTLLVALQAVKKETKVVLEDLFFDFDKWVIKPASELTLANLYDFLTDNPNIKIHIIGHTDNTGTLQHNMNLSENRAKAVFTWLTKAGIDKDRLTYEGKGPSEPIDSNDTEEGRSKNRRVEFVIK